MLNKNMMYLINNSHLVLTFDLEPLLVRSRIILQNEEKACFMLSSLAADFLLTR